LTKTATRLALLSIVAVAVLVAAGCGGSEGVPTGAVAVVDGTEITRAQLDSLIGRAKKSYASQQAAFPKAGTAEYQQLQDQAVAYLVQQVEYEQLAEDAGITVSQAEIAKRIKAVLKQPYFAGDQKKLDAELKKQGYSQAQFRADIRSLVLRDKLVANVTKDVKVDDAAAKAYYDANPGEFTVQDSRSVRHILLSVHKADDSIDWAKSRAQADDVYDQLKNGADFATLAKKYSQDEGSANNGGKYTVSRGQTVAPFEQTAFNLDTGVLSRPVKTQYGYHLIEPLGDVQPGHITPFTQAVKKIKAQLLSTKKNDAITEWAAKIKKDYEGKIEYAAGFELPATETPTTTTASQD
jgi:parvulin-like peptidyl-prolyl isomerase